MHRPHGYPRTRTPTNPLTAAASCPHDRCCIVPPRLGSSPFPTPISLAWFRLGWCLQPPDHRHSCPLLQELQAAHAAQLVAMEARMASAAEAGAEQERFFAEYVKQAEEDFEDHSERINDKITAQAEAAESREQRLKADNNILKRTNLRLKGGWVRGGKEGAGAAQAKPVPPERAAQLPLKARRAQQNVRPAYHICGCLCAGMCP
jgi:hypothetical protein